MLTKGKADYKICVMIAFCTTLHAVLKAMTKCFSAPSGERFAFPYFTCMYVCGCVTACKYTEAKGQHLLLFLRCHLVFFERGSLIGPVLTELAGLVSQGAMAICLSPL